MPNIATAACKRVHPAWVAVSDELTIIVGQGSAPDAVAPKEPVAFLFALKPDGQAVVQVDGPEEEGGQDSYDVRLLLTVSAFRRLGGVVVKLGDGAFHLPFELRAMLLALQGCDLVGGRGFYYSSAKAVELICEVMRLLEGGCLVPIAADGTLSMADSRRVLAARRMIEERCHEALTLEQIGRACGLNRAKLSRGFRSMFDCTVAEAIAARRLLQASRLLRTTDLPVSSIAYQSGYQNNASFARAFGRYFGVPPTSYRSCGLAA